MPGRCAAAAIGLRDASGIGRPRRLAIGFHADDGDERRRGIEQHALPAERGLDPRSAQRDRAIEGRDADAEPRREAQILGPLPRPQQHARKPGETIGRRRRRDADERHQHHEDQHARESHGRMVSPTGRQANRRRDGSGQPCHR